MNVRRLLILAGWTALVASVTLASAPEVFYCRYCGNKFSSVRTLTANFCQRHPEGPYKGRHALYLGAEKKEYTCIHCGLKFPSLRALVVNKCQRHPCGPYKGNHVPVPDLP